MALKLGYKASAEQFAPRALLDYAVLAEQCGFDSVWVSDHFQPFRHSGGHAPFSLAWLAALGERTQRVQLGTSVLTPSFRYHPSIVAQAFGTLGALYPGRIALGLGTGEAMNEVPATDLAWPEQRERTLRLKEAVALIRRLWSEERVSFSGEYYRTRQATIYDRPEVPVPIYIAAAGPVMARYAGASGDGFICTSGKAASLYSETLLPNVTAGLTKAGRPKEALDRMIEVKVSFDPDIERARQDTRFWGALALTPEEKMDVHDPLELERLADALPLERACSRFIVASDPASLLDDITRYMDLGFNHLVFHAPGPDQPRFIRSFAEQVMPALRQRYSQIIAAE